MKLGVVALVALLFNGSVGLQPDVQLQPDRPAPQPVIDKLDRTFHQIMADPEFVSLVTKLEFEPVYRNSADTTKYLREANVRLGRLVQELKIPKEAEK